MVGTDSRKEMPKMMPKMKKKSWHLRYKVLLCIRKGMFASQIARQLNLKRTAVDYHINRLQAMNLIELDVYSSAKLYRLTEQGNIYIQDYKMPKMSLPTKKSRLHALRITFPILQDNPDAEFERVNQRFKNWIPKYTTIRFPIGITIAKTPNKIIAMFHEYETSRQKCFTDFFNWAMRGSLYVYYFLMNRMRIKIDIFNIEATHQHLANEDPDLDGIVDRKQTTELALKRKAKGFFKTNIPAKAWLERSKGITEIETNDFLYQERLLTMPETIDRLGRDMVPMMQALTKEVNIHLELQRETLKYMKKLNRGKK